MPFGWTRSGTLLLLVYGGTVMAGAALYLLAEGGGIDAGRAVIRATVWTSIIAFLIAYSARPMHQLLRTKMTRAALVNRRYWGLSFFASHLVHLAAIIYVFDVEFGSDWAAHVPLVTLIGGGGCYLFLFAMALTSTNGWIKRLGPKNWKRLHWIGMQYAWVVFAQSYVIAMATPDPKYWRAYLFGPLLLFVLAIRIIMWNRNRLAKKA